MRNLRVEIIDSWPALWALDHEWTSLLRAGTAGSTFVDFPWMRCWSDVYGSAGSPWVLCCRDDRGMLVGAAPLFRMRVGVPVAFVRSIRFIGDIGADSDNLDVIARPGHEEGVALCVAGALERARGDWDVIELGHVPIESPVLPLLVREFEAREWLLEERRSTHVVVDFPDTWSALVSRLSPKARRSVRYRAAYMERAGETLARRCERPEDIPPFLDALFGMHNDRWGRRGIRGHFHDAKRRAFHDALARVLLARDELRFDILEFRGRPVAAHFGFRFGVTYYLLATGLDAEFSRYSPGQVLTASVMQGLITEGIRRYDFQEGDEKYKVRWGSHASAYAHIRIAPRGSLGARYLRWARVALSARARVRDALPNIWQRMRQARDRLRPNA